MVRAAAAFGRRWVFLSVAAIELGWVPFFGLLFLHPGRTVFDSYFQISQSENFISLLVVCAMALGFVSIVDTAMRMFREELDKNRQIRDDLERKVVERTADLEEARQAAQSANLAKSVFLVIQDG